MTAYIGSTTGSWLTDTNWTPTGVPGNGDTWTIANGVVITAVAGNTFIIGTSPDDDVSTPAMAVVGTNGTGKLIVAGTLIFRGSVVQGDTNNWELEAGCVIEHDSSLATTPASTNYSWRIGTTASTPGLLQARGVSGNRVIIRNGAGSGRFAGFTNGGSVGRGCVDFEYVSGTGIGIPGETRSTGWSISNAAYSGYVNRMRNCVMPDCSKTTTEAVQMDADADWDWDRTSFYDGTDALVMMIQERTGTIAFTGTRNMTNCILQGSLNIIGMRNFDGTGTAVWGDSSVKVISDGDGSPSVRTWENALIVNANSEAANNVGVHPGGEISGVMAMRAGAGEHDFMRGGNVRGYDFNYPSSVLASEDESDGGEWFIADGGSGGIRPFNVSYNLVLPADDTGGPSATLMSIVAGAAQSYKAVVDNNTIAIMDSASANNEAIFGTETQAVSAGSGESVRNNILYNGTGTDRNDYVTFDPTPGTVLDNCYTFVDYNLTFAQSRPNTFLGIYNDQQAKYANPPGVNDLTVDPEFVEDSYSVSTWLLGLDPAVTSWDLWWDKIKLMNNDSGYEPKFHWMEMRTAARAAFTPTNEALRGAGYNGSDIGAVPMLAVATSNFLLMRQYMSFAR